MTPEQLHEEVRKTGHLWIDLCVAGCALIVSVTSLFVAIRHGHSMERMADANARLVQANSWPLLQRFQSDGADLQGPRVFSLDVVNYGVGPAKVESVEVLWKGQPVKNAQQLEVLCCNGKLDDPTVETSGLMGSVLRAGEVRHILMFPEDAAHADLTGKLKVNFTGFTWKVCYCSVFDECWLTDMHTMHPPTIKECPVPKVPFRS
jgi:hypothetical protein